MKPLYKPEGGMMTIPRRLISFPSCEVLHKVWSFGCLAALRICASRPYLLKDMTGSQQHVCAVRPGSSVTCASVSLIAFSRTHTSLSLSLSLACVPPRLCFLLLLLLMPETPPTLPCWSRQNSRSKKPRVFRQWETRNETLNSRIAHSELSSYTDRHR